MSQQKKEKASITNKEIYNRLVRLGFDKVPTDFFVAYVGLNLVARGKAVSLTKAYSIIMKSHLDELVRTNSDIPCENKIEALIYIAILKRNLIQELVDNQEAEIWLDEQVAPLLDILQELIRIYRI